MTFLVPLLLWVALVAGVVLVDLGGYLLAAGRAQALADATALAGAALGPGGGVAGAEVVAGAAGGRLERCDCSAGAAVVEVSVAVPGLVVPRLGAGRVRAIAEARLVP